ncbi:low molecular weight protein-tyrosine-phosphatase [Paenibacillus sedimenti]|uniref:protein-tyrosine-phosphatase n=1 Tax=Paenibacillus sedimenti TaxID=2770274 RepID=A0A926KQL6_9BACL|nr:low molecular weight protein-tyrosine-phosphatase [Paenibacillus sedimenti]MBD0380270.1 low molecular weight phosphotyrosine protein phosphatase [Paenibacillus sedimenti]
MIQVLFVCLGNICRSPMAEAVFRHKVKEAGLVGVITTDSAGTGDWHIGERPHQGTRRILDQYRIDHQGMTAKQVKSDDFEQFTYIIAMDESNVRNMRPFAPELPKQRAEIRKLLEFAPTRGISDVPDPWYTGNFQEVYDMVEESCENLLAYIRKANNL